MIYPLSLVFGLMPLIHKENSSESQIKKLLIPQDCTPEKMALIKARPTSNEDSYIFIDCNCNLNSNDVITKRLLFRGRSASNVTFNGNGATIDGSDQNEFNAGRDMIQVYSRSFLEGETRKWERPENIKIRNVKIKGSVRIYGMAKNGEGDIYENDNGRDVNYYKESSRIASHVNTARKNAPKNIVLDRITITGTSRIPLYISPGVSYVSLINSEIIGRSESVGIYLDAESHHNTIKRNYIHPDTEKRELIAVDGSSYNDISCNNFSSLNNGGINLYRNCGEGGVIRHSTPSHNSILNNLFYYNNYDGNNTSVNVGSRNANPPGFEIGSYSTYCNDENGYPFGSSASNYDLASENIVMGNQICKRYVWQMIKITNPNQNAPNNHLGYNETIECEDIRLGDKITRKAGCYVSRTNGPNFIADGASVYLFKENEEVRPMQSINATCKDGSLVLITTRMTTEKPR